MAEPWLKFQNALTERGRSIEKIELVEDPTVITQIIRDCGITDAYEIAEITTEFKKRKNTAPLSKRIKLNSATTIGGVTACAAAGQFVDIFHLKSAGLDTVDNGHLFVRTEWAKLWTFLTGNSNLFLRGPPGTGKSSLVWAWCCWYASQNNPLRWIHITRFKIAFVVDFSGGSFQAFAISLNHLDIGSTDTPTLVLDGITRDSSNFLGDAASWWKQDEAARRLLIVSSIQYGWATEDYEQLRMATIMSHGWSMQEYEDACKDATFYASVSAKLDADPTATTISDIIEAKAFIAGASARWMFHFNSNDAIKDIQLQLQKVSSVNDLMQGLQGDSSVLAVNHLITTTLNEESIIVSQFVKRQLAKKYELSFVRSATLFNKLERKWRI